MDAGPRPRPRQDRQGGIGGSAAWWSIGHRHGAAYLTRRLADHSRAAEIAAALGDDLSVVGED
ncbi:hypothetical protein [Nonomuraea longicatena]|uniref:hypothetical protein n=1 Tax=Nonomuraea longicatena TaxID=83682 RepID=UPI0031CE73A5